MLLKLRVNSALCSREIHRFKLMICYNFVDLCGVLRLLASSSDGRCRTENSPCEQTGQGNFAHARASVYAIPEIVPDGRRSESAPQLRLVSVDVLH